MNQNIYDPIRKLWVAAQPEEFVRQNLLNHMIDNLGFPKSLLAIEKEIDSESQRRADIICYMKTEEGIAPLLMIECKAVPLTKKVIEQVLGYNYYVNARFVCVANQKQVKTLWYDETKEEYASVNFIPCYQELLGSIDERSSTKQS